MRADDFAAKNAAADLTRALLSPSAFGSVPSTVILGFMCIQCRTS